MDRSIDLAVQHTLYNPTKHFPALQQHSSFIIGFSVVCILYTNLTWFKLTIILSQASQISFINTVFFVPFNLHRYHRYHLLAWFSSPPAQRNLLTSIIDQPRPPPLKTNKQTISFCDQLQGKCDQANGRTKSI